MFLKFQVIEFEIIKIYFSSVDKDLKFCTIKVKSFRK